MIAVTNDKQHILSASQEDRAYFKVKLFNKEAVSPQEMYTFHDNLHIFETFVPFTSQQAQRGDDSTWF